MIYHDVLFDGADAGGVLGGAFVANIAEKQLVPKGKFLDHILIGFAGTISSAAVALETFLGVISQFTFKAGQETRIQLGGRDLLALMAVFYKQTPTVWENTDATGLDFVLGIKVPIQEVIDDKVNYSWSMNYGDQTNSATEVATVVAVYYEDAKGKKPIVAVPIPYTSAAATGYTNIGVQVTPLGLIRGLLVFNTTVPADGGDDFDLQRIQVLVNGAQHSKLHGAVSGILGGGISDGTLSPLQDALKVYQYWDFSEDPYDCKANRIEFSVDVETVSEATRIIPIIEKIA